GGQSGVIVGWVSGEGFDESGGPVAHGERFAGETKYSFLKMVRLALHSMTSFSQLPLQLASYTGFGAAIGGGFFAVWLIVRKLMYNVAVEGWTSLIVVVVFLGGVQLLCLRILGAY